MPDLATVTELAPLTGNEELVARNSANTSLGIVSLGNLRTWLNSPSRLQGSATTTPGPIANGSVGRLTVNVAGAVIGDLATAIPPNVLPAGVYPLQAVVTSAGVVTIPVLNASGADVNPPAAQWTAVVLQAATPFAASGGGGGTPPSTGSRLFWEIRSAGGSQNETDSITSTTIAAINSGPFDGVSLRVTGFTQECMHPGYTFDGTAFAAQLDKVAGITKRKRAVIWVSGPSDPKLDLTAWNNWITNVMGPAATILKNKGWDGIDFDPEPYQTLSGGNLVYGSSEVAAQSSTYGVPITGNATNWNATDFGWWFLFRDSSYQSILEGIFRSLGNTLAAAFPGLEWGWYHGPAVCDGVAPGWVNANQGGPGHLALGYALRGLFRAIEVDGANIIPEIMNEDFSGNDIDWGAGWAASVVNYNKASTPLASGFSTWATKQSYGHMRMRGAPRTDAAGIPQTIPALWNSLSPAAGGRARISFYFNTGDYWTSSELSAIASVKATLTP